jgi:hypothetical protein
MNKKWYIIAFLLIVAFIITFVMLFFIVIKPKMAISFKQNDFNKQVKLIEQASSETTTNDEYKNMLIGDTKTVALKDLYDNKYLEVINNPYTNSPFPNDSIIYITKMDTNTFDYHYEYADDCRYNGSLCLKEKTENDLKNNSVSYQGGTYYKGSNKIITNNYLWYSGQEYRIMGINSDGSIRIISSLPVVSLSFGATPTYENSYVRRWLNDLTDNVKDGVFYKSLHRSYFLVNYNFCTGSQDPTSETDTTCSNKVLDKVGLLSWWEYKIAGAKDSYLNIKDRLLFSTFESKNTNNILSTNYNGDIFLDDNTTYASYNIDSFFATNSIRPVINLKPTIAIFSGNGTKNNPYRIVGDTSAKKNDLLSTRYAGEYVMINDKKYRIVSINSKGNIKIVSDKRVTSTGTDKSNLYTYFDKGDTTPCNQEWPYNNCNNIFSPSDGTGKYNADAGHNIGYFLNTSYYESLGKKGSYLVDDTYHLGKWGLRNDYKNIYTNAIITKIGMLEYGEMLAGNNLNSSVNTNNYWLITPYDSAVDSLYISVSGNINIALPNYNSVGVRPTITLKSDVKIKNGDGTKNDPYIILE